MMHRFPNLKIAARIVVVALATFALGATVAGACGEEAKAAFEKLKGLEGTWVGEADGEHGIMPASHVIEVSANGTVVMETMNPGSAHEMINMYHLDGEELRLTHYCAGGNQPHMKLAADSTDSTMLFEFVGGTNLDPAKDQHIHAAKIEFVGDGKVVSSWTGWSEGKEAGVMVFALERQ